MSTQAQARPAWSWLLLAPLPILLVAFLRYRLGDHIDIDYRWMLAAFALVQSLLAAVALQAAARGSRWTWVFPLVAAMPAMVGVVVFAGPLVSLAGLLLALALLLVRIALGLHLCDLRIKRLLCVVSAQSKRQGNGAWLWYSKCRNVQRKVHPAP